MPSNDRQWRSGNRIPYGIVIHNKIVREQVKRTAGTVDNDDDGNHVAWYGLRITRVFDFTAQVNVLIRHSLC